MIRVLLGEDAGFLRSDGGGEVLVGTFKPVPVLDAAGREPWRDLYAHLMAEIGWPALAASFAETGLFVRLCGRLREHFADRASAEAALRAAPRAASFDRLVAAVGAALDLREPAPGLLDALAARAPAEGDDLAYPFAIPRLGRTGLPYLEPVAMWNALLGDLVLETPAVVIAGRFTRGLGRALAAMVRKVAAPAGDALVALPAMPPVLHRELAQRLAAAGLHLAQKGPPSCVSASPVES